MKEKDTREKRPGKNKDLKALRLLVVEDHAEMRTSLGILFKLLGCHSRFAADVGSARLAAGEEGYDILLSDINLPDGNGWDLLRELKEKSLSPQVAISMSGSVSGKDASSSQQAGFDFHLIKPFAAQELTAILERTADALTKKEALAAPQLRKKKRPHHRSSGAAGFYPFL